MHNASAGNCGAPRELPWQNGTTLELHHIKYELLGAQLSYRLPFQKESLIMRPVQVEREFGQRDSKKPVQPIIQQGKWECMPAALAMCLGHDLFHVKRLMGKAGWRNDNTGSKWEPTLFATRELGFDMIYLNMDRTYELLNKVNNAVVTIPSLNYKGRYHAVAWVNGEILDPNLGFESRKAWGPEWNPWTMGAVGLEVILKPMTKIEYYDLQTIVLRGNMDDVQQAIVECAA